MNQTEIVGLVVIGLVSVLGLIHSIMKLFITPINDLTVAITKLNTAIEHINKEYDKLEKIVNEHGERLDSLDVRLARYKD